MGEADPRENVQLIAYADRFGGSLAGLHEILDGPLEGLFAGVHVLPFFTPFDGADAGFDPVDHTEVDPRLGSWDDVRALAGEYALMVDLIVNHVSADSAQFRDVLARGDASPYAGMFLTMSDVYPGGADEAELVGIYRPRPGLPFTTLKLGERRRLVWTTFTSAQIDLNLADPAGRAYLDRVLVALAEGGVSMVRLDAVGYAIKTAGTSSFMTARTLGFIDELTARARELGVQVLVEIHAHFERQIAIGSAVDPTTSACSRGATIWTCSRSGVGRDINRHTYTPDEIARDLARPVVAALVALIRLRNAHPAFAGHCEVGGDGSHVTLAWTAAADTATAAVTQSAALDADLATGSAKLAWTGPDGEAHTCHDLLEIRHGY